MQTTARSGGRTPRRVLMTADAVGGVWTYVLELCRELSEQGVETLLATMGPPPDAEQRNAAVAIPGLMLAPGAYKLEWMDDPWEDVARAGDWLLDLAAGFGPEIVHLNGYVHATLPFRAPVVVVAHSCVLSWSRAVRGCPPPREWFHYKMAVAQALGAADMVIAPTRAMLSSLSRNYGAVVRGRVITNARDASKYWCGEKEPLILGAGRLWDEGKNAIVLDEVASGVPWPIEIAGDTRHPDGRQFESRHARLLGRLDERQLAERYARASIFAHPAKYEPFGLTVLEAALSGCALVVGDIPSLRELWRFAAVLVPPDDPDALCAALRRLIENDADRAELAEHARKRAAGFSPREMANEYLRAYRTLLEERESPADVAAEITA